MQLEDLPVDKVTAGNPRRDYDTTYDLFEMFEVHLDHVWVRHLGIVVL